MAGAPVRVPGSPASATGRVPSTVPRTMAVRPAASESFGVPGPPGWSTKIAPVKPSRLTPRLPHSPSWSKTLSACGTGSASVRATSEWRSPRTVTKVPGADVVVDVAIMTSLHTPALPGQVPTVGGAGRRPATLSARLARAPVWLLGAMLPRSLNPATEPLRPVGSGQPGWQTGPQVAALARGAEPRLPGYDRGPAAAAEGLEVPCRERGHAAARTCAGRQPSCCLSPSRR